MNKKLIAAAIAAVVAAPAVSAADTTLYGKAHVDLRYSDPGAAKNFYSVNSNASRLGVKGSEDLGDGLKAIFGYEMGYNISDGAAKHTAAQSATSQISARNAYVGLAGGFGTVLMGRHDTPAKVGFYATGNDVIGDSIVDFNKIGFLEFRLDNAVAYISPNMSGFTFAGAIVPGEGRNNRTGLADAYSLTAIYAGGGLKASVGYEVASKNTVLGASGTGALTTIGTRDHKMWQVGASYTFGDFMVGAEWEGDTHLAGSAAKRDVWGLVGKYTMGNNYIMANYGEQKLKPGIGKVTTKRFGIGIGHKFSKRTQVYAAYASQNNPTPVKDTSDFALGMIHTF